MIGVLDRYLMGELFKTLLALLATFVLILGTLGLIKLLEQAAVGDIEPGLVLPLMGYQILHYLARTLPPTFFVAVLVVLGRLYRNNEMTALLACGVGIGRIYRGFVVSLLPLVLLTAWLALWVQPWAAAQMEATVAAQRQAAAELAALRPGRFNEYSEGDLVFYVERVDSHAHEMHNIFIQNRQHGRLGLITAQRGQHRFDRRSGNHYLKLESGRRYEGHPGQADYRIVEFDHYTRRVAEGRVVVPDARSAKPSAVLARSRDPGDRAEFEERLSYPLSLITLTLIAIPLSRSLPRQGVYGRLAFAFLVYFTFLNLHTVSVSWMKKQVTPEWIGIWWVQVLLVTVALLALLVDSAWLRRIRLHWREVR